MTIELMCFSLVVIAVYFGAGVVLGWIARGIKEGR